MAVLKSLVFVFLCVTNLSFAKQQIVIFGDDHYAPYSYLQADGQPGGIYPKLLQAVFQLMPDYDVQIELVPWERAMRALEQGTVFAVFPPYLYPSSVRPFIGHYSSPLLTEYVALFCREDILISNNLEWPVDFYGLTIGITKGYGMGGETFHNAVASRKIWLTETQSNWHSLMMLSDDRIDCLIQERLSILEELQTLKEQGTWQGKAVLEVKLLDKHTAHLAFTARHWPGYTYYDHFTTQFEQALSQLIAAGELEQWLQNEPALGLFDDK